VWGPKIASPTPSHCKAEARYRVHARVEDYIRCAKNTGLASPPSWSFAINQAWCAAYRGTKTPSQRLTCAFVAQPESRYARDGIETPWRHSDHNGPHPGGV
jgi:hypothetical protein